MPGPFDSKAALERWLGDQLANRPQNGRIPILQLPEVDVDPDAPSEGALVYCIADDGAGKRAARAIFPTGAPITFATEP